MKRIEMRTQFFCLGLLTACGGAAGSGTTSPTSNDGRSVPSATTSTALNVEPAAAPTPPKAWSEPANLLDIVPATLAVSSTVDNPRDFPEHLIDGKADTAWNSKTGDLHGFIAFRVPKDAHVDAIQLTAGFAKASAKEDLFTANHRIKRVVVYHDGSVLKEADLDVNIRTLQSIPINEAGGDYKVEVKDTLPGTRKDWKELTVSEFRVVGKPGAERRAATQPLVVALKSLDRESQVPLGLETSENIVPQKTMRETCNAWLARAMDALKIPNALYAGKPGVPTCVEAPLSVPFTPQAPYASVHGVKWNDGIARGLGLVLETSRGFFFLDAAAYAVNDPTWPGCPSVVLPVTLEELRVDNGHFVAVFGGTSVTYVTPKSDFDLGHRTMLSRIVLWGKDDGTTFTTKTRDPQFHTNLGTKTQPRGRSEFDPANPGSQLWVPEKPWSQLPWVGLVPFKISSTGVFQERP